ncbi:hypothetical protein [Streptomyces sviceus]|uniref:hypothetical protein n=1 Tax=Streptomyces sviceus TaxID=285530 RepID=UPI0036E4664F
MIYKTYRPDGATEHPPPQRQTPWTRSKAEALRTVLGLLQLAASLSTLAVVVLR